ncbi:maltose/maltodextrin ABC transporter substrate-binding protein MalE [Stutzerimonas balearica]|uniref:maltose/maltodextrin ABC transporter substrate-binding protein MalE n=1 Tax=Stutzerimonas balearica TaxID=74829 RepID=UPI0028A7F44A|nr:maltose/maltodextrin ABC transporter substrate-binding protein MalE [Stutzerimonas balearica]
MRTLTKALSLLTFLGAPASALERDTLTVWITPDKGYQAIGEIGRDFTRATGMAVQVGTPEDLAALYDRQATTSQGPDIVIFAHDRFGSWINDGLLAPVNPSPAALARAPAFAWEALTVGTQRYGYPLATEAVGLIYNRDLVAEPPRSLAELATLDRRLRAEGKRAIEWDYRNLYFSWPIIAGSGGYSLRKTEGRYDLTDIGIDTPGAIEGMESIKRLLDDGLLDPAATYQSMMEGFKAGRTAMIINGPWAWNEVRQAGIRFAVGNIPTADPARPGRPFVGVLAAAINSNSPNKAAAGRFIEDYLTSAEGLARINAQKPLGAVANLALMETLRHDPLIAHTYAAAEAGEIMPDIPEMKRFWALFTPRLEPMLSGRKPIAPTLTYIAARLAKGAQMQSWRRRHYPLSLQATEQP